MIDNGNRMTMRITKEWRLKQDDKWQHDDNVNNNWMTTIMSILIG